MADDIREALRQRPMSPRQWLAVAACVLVNIVDGFEILAAGYTAPAIERTFSIPVGSLGWFLSASPLGMIVGALWLSPVADIWGRRRLVIACLVIAATGMVGMLVAHGLAMLVIARFVTGVGVGAMMVAVNTVAAEVSNARRRDLVLVLQATGFPLGGAICGLLAASVAHDQWRWVYEAGAIEAAILLPVIWLAMPESIAFLAARKPPRALARLQAVAKAFRLPPPGALPHVASNDARPPLHALSTTASIAICGSFFTMMVSFYFLASWAPRLLMERSNVGGALSGAALISVGGVVGDLAFAALSIRWRAIRLGPIFAVCSLVGAMALAGAGASPVLMPLLALCLGFFLYGAMASHYAVVPMIYPAALRSSGTGLAIGIGRIGAAIGPLLGGYLLAAGASALVATLSMTLPLLLCTGLLRWLGRTPHPPSTSG